MIRYHFLLEERVRLHPHKIINVPETSRDNTIVVGHVCELWARDFGHETAGLRGVVDL